MHEKFYVYNRPYWQVITREVIMENGIVDLNVLFLNLNNIFQVLFTIYIPTINTAFDESVHRINDCGQLNMLVSNLFQAYYQLIALVATCTHMQPITKATDSKYVIPRVCVF